MAKMKGLCGVLLLLLTAFYAPGSQAAYKDDCAGQNIPNPPDWDVPNKGGNWTLAGTLKSPLISTNLKAAVYYATSASPQGICIALPRSGTDASSPTIPVYQLFGVICLGGKLGSKTSGDAKACFWDNENLGGANAGQNYDISMAATFSIVNTFAGGPNLSGLDNGPGKCTDCHAGENPFIVNPNEAAMNTILSLTPNYEMPSNWYAPFEVPNAWPQNPGPADLSGVQVTAQQQRCTSCHQQGENGRFPAVSQQTPGYCKTVLAQSYIMTPQDGFMPPPPSDTPGDPAYSPEFAALQAMCAQNASVPLPPWASALSGIGLLGIGAAALRRRRMDGVAAKSLADIWSVQRNTAGSIDPRRLDNT